MMTTATGTYIAFLSALAVWGWIELAFLSGVDHRPEHRALPARCARGWERFLRASATILLA